MIGRHPDRNSVIWKLRPPSRRKPQSSLGHGRLQRPSACWSSLPEERTAEDHCSSLMVRQQERWAVRTVYQTENGLKSIRRIMFSPTWNYSQLNLYTSIAGIESQASPSFILFVMDFVPRSPRQRKRSTFGYLCSTSRTPSPTVNTLHWNNPVIRVRRSF
jgi:hypothetical protein